VSNHLTPLDATFLELEQADETAHMHIGGIMVFDPLPAAGTPSHDEVCRHLADRLTRLPRYRQRLSKPHTGGLSWPQWEDDLTFEVSRHLTRAALPSPGGYEELAQWSSEFFSQRLDRHRPLWEMALVEGLSEGRWALAHKTHHCMVDGVGSVDVGYVLLDTNPHAAPPPSSASSPNGRGRGYASSSRGPERPSSGPESRAGSRAWLAQIGEGLLPLDTIRHTAELGAHGMLHPREALRNARSALELIVRDELRGAPHTSLNEPIGTRRRFDVISVPLAELKEIRSSLGGTVNDVVLAATASGLRALLQSRGEQIPIQGLRAMVPMNVRIAGDHLALGNRVSSLFVELPVAEPELVARHRETVARSQSLKAAGEQAAGSTAVMELAGLAPPLLHSTIARALYATRLFNLTITNVPGPQERLYALGAPLREVYPLVPLAAEHAIGVAAFSYDGNIFFGVVVDRDGVPDLEVFLAAMRSSLEELLSVARMEAAGSPRGSSGAARRRRHGAAEEADARHRVRP
jgi:WS/DGAT/MGAT family acyltransferase